LLIGANAYALSNQSAKPYNLNKTTWWTE